MRLYDLPRSPWCQQVRVVLAEKNLPHERHIVLPGQEYDEWFIELNRLARTPVLVDHDQVLREAQVICEYLDEAYPDRPLMPDVPGERAAVRMLMSLTDQFVGPSLEDLYLAIEVDDEQDEALLRDLRDESASALDLLEEALCADVDWAAGPTFTLADTGLMPFLLGLVPQLDMGPLLLEFPRLEAYRSQLALRASSRVIQQAADEWAEMEALLPE